MSSRVFTDAEREEIKAIVRLEIKEGVHEALVEFFKAYGTTSRNVLLSTALILAAIVGIVVSLKTMLGWLGIIVIRP